MNDPNQLFQPDLSGLPGNLHLGTSSWSSPDWKGVFYPPRTASGDFIREYSRRLPTVEIDSSFYRCPSPETVDGWARKTPPGFVFSAKVPRVITHEKELVDCQRETEGFLETMSRLGDKLGPLVFQFAYVARGKDPGEYKSGARFRERLAKYLEKLPREFRFAVEIRNGRWLDDDFLALLKANRVALVLSDYYTMPALTKLETRIDPLTADFSFVRFLGNRREIDQLIARKKDEEDKDREFDELVLDRTREMRSWVPALRRLLPRTTDIFAYFNNHYAGFGPGSAALFAATWREMKSEMF